MPSLHLCTHDRAGLASSSTPLSAGILRPSKCGCVQWLGMHEVGAGGWSDGIVWRVERELSMRLVRCKHVVLETFFGGLYSFCRTILRPSVWTCGVVTK